jgi:hypothetical protein
VQMIDWPSFSTVPWQRHRRGFPASSWDEFESSRKIGHEHPVRVGFGAHSAPSVEAGVHLRDQICLGAGVLREVEPPAGIENPFVEAVEKRPDIASDREVQAEHEAIVTHGFETRGLSRLGLRESR